MPVYGKPGLGSCVLWLPFYKYGAEAKKIYDWSGLHNDGTITGATPATYSLPSGVELISNGGFETGNPPTGWTAIYTPEVFEQSSTHAHSGTYSAHVNDSTPSQGGFVYGTPGIMAAANVYKLSFWYWLVSGTLQAYSYNTDEERFTQNYTTTGSWQYAEIIVPAGNRTAEPRFTNASNSVAAEFYIDDVSVQQVNGYSSIGWGFDGVSNNIAVPTISMGMNSITYLAWVRFGRNNTAEMFIFTAGNNGFSVYPWTSGAPRIYGYLYDGTNLFDTYIGNSYIPTNQWVLVGAVFNRTTNMAYGVYNSGYDNAGAGISNVTGTVSLTTPYTPHTSFYGQIGEVLIYNVALAPSDIKSYYDMTRGYYGV